MKLLIVDDEAPARARLTRLLGQLGETDVAEAKDVPDAERCLDASEFDAVFLDITMPGVDGLSFASLRALPVVVFVTGDASHAARAFDVEAADFLVKPVPLERLRRALERARRRAGLRPTGGDGPRLRVADAGRERYVDAEAIEHLRADAKYVVATIGNEEIVLRDSLDALEGQLPTHIRVHRAHLVRLAAIVEVRTDHDLAVAVLRSGHTVPVSRRAVATLRARLRAR